MSAPPYTPKWREILAGSSHRDSIGRYGAQQLVGSLFTAGFWHAAVDYCADMEEGWMQVECVLELLNPVEARFRCLEIARDPADQDRAARAILLLERMPNPDVVTPLRSFVCHVSSEVRYATTVVLETLARLEIGDQAIIRQMLIELSVDLADKVSERARNCLRHAH